MDPGEGLQKVGAGGAGGSGEGGSGLGGEGLGGVCSKIPQPAYTPATEGNAAFCVENIPYAIVPTTETFVEGSAASKDAGKAVMLLPGML